MSTRALDIKVNREAIAESFITLKGRIMGMELEGDCYKTRLRSGKRNVLIDVPKGLMESSSATEHSVVSIATLSGDGVAVAEKIELVCKAKELPVRFEDLGYADLEYRHLYIRSDKMLATAQFRHYINKYAREYLDGEECICVQTPILTEATCVCSGDVFTFPYYGKKIASLIQSPWMYADAMTSGFDRVYALNPSFRREKAASSTHLVEIWQLQVDVTWADNDNVMQMEEDLLKYVAGALKENHSDLYKLAGLSSTHLDDVLKPFCKVSYQETVDIINEQGLEMENGADYTDEQQDALAAQFDRPFFITDFPQKLKNFWFPVYPDNPEFTPSNDLFAHTGHGEIIGGGQRVADPEQLKKNLKYFGHDEEEFGWFLDIREYGCVPHAGFSIGFDRLVAFMMGVSDITEACIFPRIPYGPIKP